MYGYKFAASDEVKFASIKNLVVSDVLLNIFHYASVKEPECQPAAELCSHCKMPSFSCRIMQPKHQP
jgi:hypothetical protein